MGFRKLTKILQTTLLQGIVISTISGCASFGQDENPQPVVPQPDKEVVTLQKTADAIYEQLKILNKPQQTAVQSVVIPKVVTGCGTHMVSIDFDGNAQTFIDDISKVGICKVNITGKVPPQDLILSIHHHHDLYWHVVEDFGVQMGTQATIELTPDSVNIRYSGQLFPIPEGTVAKK